MAVGRSKIRRDEPAGKRELRGDHFNAGRKTKFVEKCQSKAKG
jgi:hypothetical protein